MRKHIELPNRPTSISALRNYEVISPQIHTSPIASQLGSYSHSSHIELPIRPTSIAVLRNYEVVLYTNKYIITASQLGSHHLSSYSFFATTKFPTYDRFIIIATSQLRSELQQLYHQIITKRLLRIYPQSQNIVLFCKYKNLPRRRHHIIPKWPTRQFHYQETQFDQNHYQETQSELNISPD